MSIAVSCNLSDGVILGVDSAVTVPGPASVLKVYENAEKLFQVGNRPIGVAVFGLAVLGQRTIGSYIREFANEDRDQIVSGQNDVATVVEGLRAYLLDCYTKTVVPAIEAQCKMPFDKVPPNQVPALGLAVGGFSHKAPLSEVWEVMIPRHKAIGSANRLRAPGDFASNWFALYDTIHRYFKGYDRALMSEVLAFVQQLRGAPLSKEQEQQLQQILAKHEYPVPYAAMPIEEGIQHVRFLIELVINHFRFAIGAPVVGGRARIGRVTYRDAFEIIEPGDRRARTAEAGDRKFRG